MTHNVNGLGDFKARKRYFNFMLKQKKDIILLQETHSTEKDESVWRNGVRSEIIFSHGTSMSRGVCIILRKTPDIKLLDSIKDAKGRFLLVKVEVNKKMYAICNVYAPNNEKEQVDFLNKVELTLQEYVDTKETLIIGGDFNLIQNLNLDRAGGSMKTVWNHSVNCIEQIKMCFGLVDIWRVRNPIKKYSHGVDITFWYNLDWISG